eukprot:7306510-Lingulodinium_polyedra.AAC.1
MGMSCFDAGTCSHTAAISAAPLETQLNALYSMLLEHFSPRACNLKLEQFSPKACSWHRGT